MKAVYNELSVKMHHGFGSDRKIMDEKGKELFEVRDLLHQHTFVNLLPFEMFIREDNS